MGSLATRIIARVQWLYVFLNIVWVSLLALFKLPLRSSWTNVAHGVNYNSVLQAVLSRHYRSSHCYSFRVSQHCHVCSDPLREWSVLSPLPNLMAYQTSNSINRDTLAECICFYFELSRPGMDCWSVAWSQSLSRRTNFNYWIWTCPDAAGFDTSIHISEEARNAPRAVPFAILSSTIVGLLLGWCMLSFPHSTLRSLMQIRYSCQHRSRILHGW